VDAQWRNAYGTAKPYTRHISACTHAEDPDYNKCSCPKWLFTYRKGQKPRRFTLETPSWAEAVRKAHETLRGWDPEIAAARAEKKASADRKTKRLTVDAAIKLWLDRTATKFGAGAAILNQYRSTFGWRDDKGNPRGHLLQAVEKWNQDPRHPKIESINDITPLFGQVWHDSWSGSAATRSQRWRTVRSFFNFLYQRGVIESNPVEHIEGTKDRKLFAHVPYTDEQFERILGQAAWYVDDRVQNGEREVHCCRSQAFLQLLRNTGMDLGDAVEFEPASMLTTEVVDGKAINVIRYRRSKTGIEAVIVIDDDLASSLRNVPLAPDSVPDRPFRYQGNLRSSDVHNWSRRIATFIKLAKIGRVQLIRKDGTAAVDERGTPVTRNPDAKMLRHTFAVGELLKGRRPEVVAKQMGHVNTDMIFAHYAPWCKARDLQHLREQM
jgi:integrase